MMTLAARIDKFMSDYDTYGYMDALEYGQENMVDSISSDLAAGETDHIIDYFNEAIEDMLIDNEDGYFTEDIIEARNILEKLENKAA